jgi:serpin B
VVAAFDAVVESRDFDDPATVDAINAWVEEKTEGYIDSIVDMLSPSDVMLLVNAIYFDAEWTLQFDPDHTRTQDFHLEDGGTVPVEMMSLDEADVRLVGSPDYLAAELPYGGEAFSMVVVLPPYGVPVRELLAHMDGADWGTLLAGLGEVEGARIELPKFTLTHEAWLNDALMDMGMEIAFTPDADFTRLSPFGDQLCISYVRQKTFIEVDERGTRAAAATAVGVGVTSAPAGFVADRPFAFLIRERLSETILFAGLVGDPTAEDPGPEDPTVLCG